MTFSSADLGHSLLAIALLVIAAHSSGYLFQRLGQPTVIGEILGGLLLGPTVLGLVWPQAYQYAFESNTSASVLMGGVYALGLQLLMFCSGLEIRGDFSRSDRRSAMWISGTGTIVPFTVSMALVPLLKLESQMGPAANATAFTLVVSVAIAVTSIPVISRVFRDLGIITTPFARIVLAAAVLEDVALYVVLSIAVSLAATSLPAESFGLGVWLGLDERSGPWLVLHSVATLLFLSASAVLGPKLVLALEKVRYNFPLRHSPIGFYLALMLGFTLFGLVLGISPMLGAFAGGIAVGKLGDGQRARTLEAITAIKQFAFAFFIPTYFAIVGLRIDLVRDFDPTFFGMFLLAASAVKLTSVYLGAWVAGENQYGALNFAVAMNARGGPGIVLASVALDTGIVSERFYTSLVLLAILTTTVAGAWLGYVVRRGASLR